MATKQKICKHCNNIIYYDEAVDIWSISRVWFVTVCEQNPDHPKRHEPHDNDDYIPAAGYGMSEFE